MSTDSIKDGRWSLPRLRQRRSADRFLPHCIALIDFLVVVVVGLSSDVLFHIYAHDQFGSPNGLRVALLLATTFMFVQAIRNAYAPHNVLRCDRDLRITRIVWTSTIIANLVLLFLIKESEAVSRGAFVLTFGLGYVALSLACRLQQNLVRYAVRTARVVACQIALVGKEEDVVHYLKRYKPWDDGVVPAVAILHPDTDNAAHRVWIMGNGIVVAHSRLERLRILRNMQPDAIIIVASWNDPKAVEAFIEESLPLPAKVLLAPDPSIEEVLDNHVEKSHGRHPFRDASGIIGLSLFRAPLGSYELAFKRIFDIAGASIGLLLLSPLFLLIALAIKMESPGPVFFQQKRNGFNEHIFNIYKFRTMTHDSPSQFLQTRVNDSRVTRFGRWLRRTNVDELPQLFNVLRGEMSLVGPRPHAVEHNSAFMDCIAGYASRHHVKPGITGWAQINGLRGAANTDAKMQARLTYDLHYIHGWSLEFDMQILFMTLFSQRAYQNAR